MRSTSSPAGSPREPAGEKRSGVLDDLLCIDGVTDLAVYRLLTGRGEDLVDVEVPPRPDPDLLPSGEPGEQLALFLPLSSEGEVGR